MGPSDPTSQPSPRRSTPRTNALPLLSELGTYITVGLHICWEPRDTPVLHRCRAISEHISQSRTESGLGLSHFQPNALHSVRPPIRWTTGVPLGPPGICYCRFLGGPRHMLLQVPRGRLFLMSEVPLYRSCTAPKFWVKRLQDFGRKGSGQGAPSLLLFYYSRPRVE